MSLLTLVAVLAVALAALLPDLLAPDPVVETEARTVASAVETWHRLNRVGGDSSWLEPWTPFLYGEPITDQPPGGVWWSVVALMPLDQAAQRTSAETRTPPEPPAVWKVLAATRGGGVAAVLLVLSGIFWVGYGIGGYKTGFFSSLAALGAVGLLLSGRLALPVLASCAMLSVAMGAAIWAVRPLRPAPSVVRQVLGWLIFGLCLAAAFLIGGWLAVAMILLPLLAIVLLCPGRVGHLFGLVAGTGVAVLVVTPWVWHVAAQSPQLSQLWLARWWMSGPGGFDEAMLWVWVRLALVLVVSLPWTLWLIGAVMQPFSSSSRPVRRRMLIGWLWFVVSVLLLVAVGPLRAEIWTMMLGLPATAVLMGQVFRQYSDLCKEGRHANLWQGLKWPFLVSLALLSVLLPLAVKLQPWAIDRGWLSGAIAQIPTWTYTLGAMAVLVILSGLVISYGLTHRPGRTLTFSAIWSVCAVSLVMLTVTRGPLAVSPWHEDAQRVLAAIDTQPVYFWQPTPANGDGEADDPAITPSPKPPAKLTVLLGRPLLPLSPQQIPVAVAGEQPVDTPPLFVLIHGSQQFSDGVQVFDSLPLTHADWRLCRIEVDPLSPPQDVTIGRSD